MTWANYVTKTCEDKREMLHDPLQRARQSLLGLCLGDALGSQFFVPGNRHYLVSRSLPPAPWQWTDDTEMACSVFVTLAIRHSIDQDDLAASFATRHDFDRGYGPPTNRLRSRILTRKRSRGPSRPRPHHGSTANADRD